MLKWEFFPEAEQVKLDYAKEIVYPITEEGPLLDEIRVKVGETAWVVKSAFDTELSFIKKVFNMVRPLLLI